MSTFQDYFKDIYRDRWASLEQALHAPAERMDRSVFEGHAQYRMDTASIRAAKALRVQEGDEVLDLCAAPGGKTLILLEALDGTGNLTANELSFARRKRLEEVIRTHVPSTLQGNIKISGYDGNQFGLKKKEYYDRILLDAPCSSERHLLELDPEMKEWKLSRTTQLAKRQYSLLCSAILALKSGGVVVYSTCSISPLENDGVMERVLERKSDLVRLDEDVSDLSDLERTKFGFQIFPDCASGAGPMYIARLVKF